MSYLIDVEIADNLIEDSVEVVEKRDDFVGRGRGRNGGETTYVAEIDCHRLEVFRRYHSAVNQLIGDRRRQQLDYVNGRDSNTRMTKTKQERC